MRGQFEDGKLQREISAELNAPLSIVNHVIVQLTSVSPRSRRQTKSGTSSWTFKKPRKICE